MRCLSALIPRITESRIKEVAESLAEGFAAGREALRDVYAIGLKTLVMKAPDGFARCVCDALVARMLTLVETGGSVAVAGSAGAGAGAGAAKGVALTGAAAARATGVMGDVRCQSLDVLADVLKRFGTVLMPTELAAILSSLQKALGSAQAGVRNRAGTTLAAASKLFDESLLDRLLSSLLAGVEAARGRPDDDVSRSLIVTLGYIAHALGPRLARYVPRVVPLLLAMLGDADAVDGEKSNTDALNELRENILQAFEALWAGDYEQVLIDSIPPIIAACVKWAQFDPNYTYSDEGGSAMDVDGADEGWDDDDGDDNGGDDDDSSWRTRRAAVRVLVSAIAYASSGGARVLHAHWQSLAPLFVGRIKERDETVRLEVVGALRGLITSVHKSLPGARSSRALTSDAFTSALTSRTALAVPGATGSSGDLGTDGSALAYDASAALLSGELVQYIAGLVPAIVRIISSTDPRTLQTRTAALGVFRAGAAALETAAPGANGAPQLLAAHSATLVPALVQAIKFKGAGVGPAGAAGGGVFRLEAVLATSALLAATAPAAALTGALLPHIVPALVEATRDTYDRVAIAALRVLALTAQSVRPADSDAPATLAPATCAGLDAATVATIASSIATAILPRLSAADADADVKGAVLAAAASLLAHAGDVPALGSARTDILRLVGERIKAEASRVPALRAAAYVAASPLVNDAAAAPLFTSALEEIGHVLRLDQRALRITALGVLCTLAECRSDALALAPVALHKALMEMTNPSSAGGRVADTDILATALSFGVAAALTARLPPAALASLIEPQVLPFAMRLAGSSALAGSALASLKDFFTVCGRRALPSGGLALNTLIHALCGAAAGLSSAGVGAGAAAGAGGASRGATAAQGGAPVRASVVTCAKSISALLLAAPAAASAPILAAFAADAATVAGGGGGYADGAMGGVATSAAAPPATAVGGKTRRKSSGMIDAAVAATASAAAIVVPPHPVLSCFVIGDVGRKSDVLVAHPALLDQLILAAATATVTSSDDIRPAVAAAIGGIVAGAVGAALPRLLMALSNAPPGDAFCYTLLTALRDVTRTAAHSAIAPAAHTLLAALTSPTLFAAPDEGVRALAAECVGNMAGAAPEAVFATIRAQATSPAVFARWSAATALRHAATNAGRGIAGRSALSAALSVPGGAAALLAPLADEDILPRVAALGAVTAIANALPAVILPQLGAVPVERFPFPPPKWEAPAAVAAAAATATAGSDAAGGGGISWIPPIMPNIAAEGVLAGVLVSLVPRPDLVRKISMGELVHKVDDGLPLRQAALAALVAILAAGGALAEATPFLLKSLADDLDVILQTHNALVFLSGAPVRPRPLPALFAARTGNGDAIANALGVVIYPAPWDARKLTVTRSALRALHALHTSLPAMTWAASPQLAALLTRINSVHDLKELYVAVVNES